MPLGNINAPDQTTSHPAPSPTHAPQAQPLHQGRPFPSPFPLNTYHQTHANADSMTLAVTEAVQRGDMDKLLELLEAGADVRQAGPFALKMAALENNVPQVRNLLATLQRAGVDINTMDPHGDTALSVAARDGHHEVIAVLAAALLDSGGNINAAGRNGFTPLSEAAYKGHREAAAVLIEALQRSGGELNPSNEYGFTPLTRAAYMGQWEVVHLLASALHESGGDVNVVTPGCGSALTLAIEDSNLDAVDRLLKTGALASEEDMQDIARLLGFGDVGGNYDDVLARAAEKQFTGIFERIAQHMEEGRTPMNISP